MTRIEGQTQPRDRLTADASKDEEVEVAAVGFEDIGEEVSGAKVDGELSVRR